MVNSLSTVGIIIIITSLVGQVFASSVGTALPLSELVKFELIRNDWEILSHVLCDDVLLTGRWTVKDC